jgi:hypothetical protein
MGRLGHCAASGRSVGMGCNLAVWKSLWSVRIRESKVTETSIIENSPLFPCRVSFLPALIVSCGVGIETMLEMPLRVTYVIPWPSFVGEAGIEYEVSRPYLHRRIRIARNYLAHKVTYAQIQYYINTSPSTRSDPIVDVSLSAS